MFQYFYWLNYTVTQFKTEFNKVKVQSVQVKEMISIWITGFKRGRKLKEDKLRLGHSFGYKWKNNIKKVNCIVMEGGHVIKYSSHFKLTSAYIRGIAIVYNRSKMHAKYMFVQCLLDSQVDIWLWIKLGSIIIYLSKGEHN